MDEGLWGMMFRGRWKPGTQSGRKTLQRCNTRNNSNDFDTENEGSEIDVIIIDSPECSSERSRPSSSSSLKRNKKCYPRRLIIIDEENNDYFGFGNGDQSTPDRNSHHYSSSSSYFPVDSDSDSDYGCEIMDDPTGDFRKEWEKAYLMKRKDRNHVESNGEQRVPCATSQKNADLVQNRSSCFDADTSKNSEYVTSTSASLDLNKNVDEKHDDMGEDASNGMFRNGVNDEREQSDHGMTDQMSDMQHDAIAELDKHKESVEYRLAQEEEWAARRQQIKIQQEEAQRLRKRKKAQTLRLLDMERRQKQRVEEIRESQKRNEETIDLKDNLRAMIRKELEFLELKHRDMASLLRALGINVRGGSFPLSSEVNSAFKQALFRFHPDRASRTDIREQVEAEEKFKLVSRLKQRLQPVA